MITRREALALFGSAVAAAALFRSFPALAQNVPVEALAQPGPLGDVALGPADAKVTIIEYASITCSHCAAFHKETYPELKKRYIDTGKVRFILREFPLDPLATAGFMLARCAAGSDGGKYYALVDTLFPSRATWAFVKEPLPPLRTIGKQAGLSEKA